MFRSYDHLHAEIYTSEINMADLNLGVCILLRVLDQVQGFPSNATLFQYFFTILFKITATCFGRTTIFMRKYIHWKLT
jgi:hypothetical protein